MTKKLRLGADPLSQAEQVIDSLTEKKPLKKRYKTDNQSKPIKQSKQGLHSKHTAERPQAERGLAEGWTRAAFIVRKDNLNKIKALAYWTPGLTIKEVLDQALNEYLKGKKVKPIPEKQ